MRISSVCPDRPAWDAAAFPGELDEARDRLRERVCARIDPSGAVRDPCRSRVLESALALRAVQRVGGYRQAERRLAEYLRRHCDDADPLDRLFARIALDPHAVTDRQEVECFFRRVPEFTSARKRATLAALLAALGVQPHDDDFAVELAGDGLHPWARVQVTAVKVILAVTTGRPGQVTAADVELLSGTQQQDDVWERDLLVHLSAVHALLLLPGSQDIGGRGVGKALRYQRSDGGLPFISDTDTWCTATGGVALAAAGAPPALLHRLAGHLVARQSPDGGWSFTDHVELCDTDDVSVTLEFLQQLDPVRYRPTIERGLAWLRRIQAPDGGFPTYPGTPPEGCMTAAAVNAMNARPGPHFAACDRAVIFLAAHQRPDGTFPPDWSASRFHTIFRAVLACTHPAAASRQEARRTAQRALGAVREGQNPDGGWGQQPGDPSDAISTAYALIALTRQADPQPAVAGLRHLLGARRPDGSIAAVSDSIGPRPLIFTIPALADIFTLLALGHLTAACDPRSGLSQAASTLAVKPRRAFASSSGASMAA